MGAGSMTKSLKTGVSFGPMLSVNLFWQHMGGGSDWKHKDLSGFAAALNR